MSGKCGTVDHISRICEVCKVNPMINDLNIPLKMPHIGYTNWFLLLCYLPCVGTCGLRTCTTWLNKKASERKRPFSMLFYGPCVTEIKSATDPAKQRFSFPSQLSYSFLTPRFAVTLYQFLLFFFCESWPTSSCSFFPGMLWWHLCDCSQDPFTTYILCITTQACLRV